MIDVALALQRITGWFSYRASSRNSHELNIWSSLLKRVHQESNTKPRRRSAAQQFMQEEPSIVNAAFVSKYGEGRGMEPIEKLNKRNELARQLVTTSYKHLVPGLDARAKATHERELKEWKLELDDIEQAEDVSMYVSLPHRFIHRPLPLISFYSARNSLFSAVHPLLKFIGTYSGCYVTLLVASPGHEDEPYFSTYVEPFVCSPVLLANAPILVSITSRSITQCESTGRNSTNPASRMASWAHSSSTSSGWVRSFLLVQSAKSDHYPEAPESEQSEKSASTPKATPDPSVPPPPILPTKAASSKIASTSQQPGRYKKRPFTYTEDNSEEDDDVDMDNIDDNDSSGSSVDSDHVPAKRLRTSITTRGSRNTPALESPTNETNIHQSPPSAVNDNSLAPGDLNVEPEPEAPRSSPGNMDIDNLGASPEPYNVASSNFHHIHGSVSPRPATPLQPRSPSPGPASDSELGVPEFLGGKHDIYAYLSNVEEAGFQALLKSYIMFEHADRSSIRGTFTTSRRPNAIGWWSGRARPNKLPPYDSLSSFTGSILEWWTFIQPEWRKVKPGEITRTKGDWERLYQPGINGLLNVIVLAYWWARILGERESPVDDTYSWFVSDVTWVLSQLTAAARQGIY